MMKVCFLVTYQDGTQTVFRKPTTALEYIINDLINAGIYDPAKPDLEQAEQYMKTIEYIEI